MPSIPRALLALLGLACGAAHARSAGLSKPGLEIEQEIAEALRARIRLHLHNLANVYTCGYKRRIPSSIGSPAAGAGNLESHERDWNQGVIEGTGRRLDLAIEGPGLLALSDPEGGRIYTRGGNLRVDGEGFLCTSSGFRIFPALQVPPATLEIVITMSGAVMVTTEADPMRPARIGSIGVYVFPDPAGLAAHRANTFRPTPASGPARALRLVDAGEASPSTFLIQGFLERSNVVWAEELLHLQAARRQLRQLNQLDRVVEARSPASTGSEGTAAIAALFRRLADRMANRGFRFTGQGEIVETGHMLDVAIQGAGFFKVCLPGGTSAYTRRGDFVTDEQGRLLTSMGLPLSPPILIPPEAISLTIAPDGWITAITAADRERQISVGRIYLAHFPDPGLLIPGREGLLLAPCASECPSMFAPGPGRPALLVQCSLERSDPAIPAERAARADARRMLALLERLFLE